MWLYVELGVFRRMFWDVVVVELVGPVVAVVVDVAAAGETVVDHTVAVVDLQVLVLEPHPALLLFHHQSL